MMYLHDFQQALISADVVMSDVEKLVTLVHGHQEALALYNLSSDQTLILTS